MFPSGIVASIQPRWNSAFNNHDVVAGFALECAKYAVALRIEGVVNVKTVAGALERFGLVVPIIGLIKERVNELNTLITVMAEGAEELVAAGADYVAMECSDRLSIERIRDAVGAGVPVIADIGAIEYADIARGCGVCALTTALSGYLNQKTHPFVGPDIELVRKAVDYGLPVIAEGRYRTPKQLEMAREAGAHAVCMGDAIHEPRNIVLHSRIIFNGSWKELAKNDFRDLD